MFKFDFPLSINLQIFFPFLAEYITDICQHYKLNITNLQITLSIMEFETPEHVLLQTVKTQMKCSLVLHFIRAYTVCKGKTDIQTKEYNTFWKL